MKDYKDLKKLTDELIESLSKEFVKVTMDLWFKNMSLYTADEGGRFTLLCESEFKRRYIEDKYKSVITEHLEKLLNRKVVLVTVSPDTLSDEMVKIPLGDILASAPSSQKEEKKLNIQSPSEGDGKGSSDEYTFSNFITGSSNEFTFHACVAVAQQPFKLYNPLFIYGVSGVGKTHLLHATYNEAKRCFPNFNIIYTTGEDFTNQLILAINKNKADKMEEFRNHFRNVDMLMIDDVHFIAGKQSTQEEFFHTFNTLTEMKKQIILTSDRPPNEIAFLEKRLLTRFSSGLITEILPPDVELRAAIFRQKADSMNIRMDDKVIMYLSENVRDNIRQIEGSLKALRAHSLISGKSIDMDLAKNVLVDYLSAKTKESVTPEKIINFFCRKYGVTRDELLGQSRRNEIISIRHLCIYVIKTLTDLNYKEIGKIFKKDRTSIMYSHGQVERNMKSDSEFSKAVEGIIKEIKDESESN